MLRMPRMVAFRLGVVCVVSMLGCGSVQSDPDLQPQDAAAADVRIADDAVADAVSGDDAPAACRIHDTVESCGAACVACPAAGDREIARCNGTACEVGCADSAPTCSDDSCARMAWTFDSNQLDGIAPRAPLGLRLVVRNHDGNLALAADVTNLSEISFTIPICLSGNIQLQTKTLSATVYFEGGTTTANDYFVQASVPAPRTGAYLATKSLSSNATFTYSSPISMSQFANTATDIVFQAGSLGVQFSGTIWFDDIKVQ